MELKARALQLEEELFQVKLCWELRSGPSPQPGNRQPGLSGLRFYLWVDG